MSWRQKINNHPDKAMADLWNGWGEFSALSDINFDKEMVRLYERNGRSVADKYNYLKKTNARVVNG